MTPLKRVAVGVDGECIGNHDDEHDEDEAVLRPYLAYGAEETIFLFHCATST